MKSLSREPIPLAYLPRSIRDGHFEDGLRHVDRDRRRLHADSSHPARCRRYATVARSCPLSRERSPFDHYIAQGIVKGSISLHLGRPISLAISAAQGRVGGGD